MAQLSLIYGENQPSYRNFTPLPNTNNTYTGVTPKSKSSHTM
jgi:hypothetical protein